MRLQHAIVGLVGAVCLISATPTFGAQISKVSGRKVLLNLDGDAAKAGDVFVVYNPKGKKAALVKIKSVSGSKAIGILGKGKAAAGWNAKISEKTGNQKAAASGRTKKSAAADESSGGATAKSYWGLVGGLAMDSMSVDIDNAGTPKTVALSGTAFSAKGLFDYELFPQVWFRGLAGIEGLNASGSTEAGCDDKACSVSIYYLSADFWARYVFSSGTFRPWLGGAFSLMFPLTKDATALEDSSITNTSALSVGGGFDWFTSDSFYIPVQVEYSMLPKSETVEASVIAARIGFAITF